MGIAFMGVVGWIVIGVVAGAVASRIVGRTLSPDLLLNMVVGAVGAAAGGFTTNLVIRQPVFDLNLQSALVAGLATVVFLFLWTAVRQR